MRPMSGFGRSGVPSFRSAAAKLALALVVGSVLAKLMASAGVVLYLAPDQVLSSLALWQPITFIPVEGSPMGIIFGALILWSIGGAMEATWGSKRLLRVVLTITFLAGLFTVALGAAFDPIRAWVFSGGNVMTTVVWIAYGLSVGRAQTNFWGIPITGHVLAGIGAGFVFLSALFGSFIAVIPEVAGMAMIFGYVKLGSPRVFWLRFQGWRLQRQLKSRSKHLRVIGSDRNTSGGSDRFLH